MERHRVDALSLVFGLIFAAAGLLLLGGGPTLVDRLPMAWVGPIVAIGLGVILLLAARPEREAASEDDTEPELPDES
jgi:hypothetical protein